MKTASNPSMVGSSRQCMLKEASCCRCLNRSFEVPAERLRYPEESRKTTSNEEWKESRGGWRRVKGVWVKGVRVKSVRVHEGYEGDG